MTRSRFPFPPVGVAVAIAIAVAIAVAVAAATAGTSETAPSRHQVIETTHYRLESEASPAEAAEQARVLEAAWQAFSNYFKAKPRLRKGALLPVRWFVSRKSWAAAIRADGATPPDKGGGLYWPGTKTAYAYRQPTVYNSRMLLLHEAAHQFHFLAKTRNKPPAASWYTEGLAEFLGRHFWDGKHLQLGVLPLISLSDYAAKALAEARAKTFNLATVVKGDTPCSRPIAWALYRYLATGNKGKPLKGFSAFSRKMDGGVRPETIFRKRIGRPKSVQPAFRAWLAQEREQEPFASIFVQWEGIGPRHIRGFSQRSIACRLKRPATFFEATLEAPATKGWRGGVLLHYQDAANYSVALLDWAGFVRIARRVDGSWQTMEQGAVPGLEKGKRIRFQLFRRKGQVSMMIGQVGFGPWKLPGTTFGLAVERCDLRFDHLAWK